MFNRLYYKGKECHFLPSLAHTQHGRKSFPCQKEESTDCQKRLRPTYWRPLYPFHRSMHSCPRVFARLYYLSQECGFEKETERESCMAANRPLKENRCLFSYLSLMRKREKEHRRNSTVGKLKYPHLGSGLRDAQSNGEEHRACCPLQRFIILKRN